MGNRKQQRNTRAARRLRQWSKPSKWMTGLAKHDFRTTDSLHIDNYNH
ncbi:hypothetical protein PDR5_31010 [Pseudomonas sp. DR 5-09]|nr:hypothetical protein PDR5_31010 [Pseudomonas sp. DR 5-09]